MTQPPPPPPGWYPDPAGGGGVRWWDGQAWTDHVQQAVQQTQVMPPSAGGPSLFEQPVLVVSQKTKLIELTNEYAVYDGGGQQIGAVAEIGQSSLKKAVRFVSNLDQFLTHRLEVRDARGPVLVLTRPAKVMKSRVVVTRPDGSPVGEIMQANVFGKIRFDLVAGGQVVGAIQAENWRAWNFAITDGAGTEVARITKTWEGLAKTLFTTADNYVVHVHVRLADPLAALAVAAALTVDTALKQDDRGFN
ncbi:MAG: phospholipid scramblase-related protein [Blastococcus sp.]